MSSAVDQESKPGAKVARGERRAMRHRMKDLLLFLPNMLKLLLRLVRDTRVSRSDKLILGGTILYVIAPLDFLPDMIPFIGQIDDSYLVAISLLRLLSRADGAIVMEHWDGEMDLKRLVDSVASVASHFLPESIRHALMSRIDVKTPQRLRVVKGGAGS
ncbi:MAG TPA: YkvA family protein [Blastocatellia bacterium]|nr:YkvA family protein [Blastocatellia bacterium]